MKRFIQLSVIVVFCTTTASELFSQSLTTFPTDCNPVEVSSESVAEQAKSLASTCGFESAYFSVNDIKDLLSISGCVGVRFYVSMESKSQKYTDVMAVSINKNGTELKGSNSQRQYLMTKPMEVQFLYNAIGMNQYEAKNDVSNLDNSGSKINHFVSYIGKDGLDKLLMSSGCDGIRVYPSEVTLDGASYLSMAYGSVGFSKNDLTNLEDVYLQSQHPCPIDCGGDGDKNYLWTDK